MKCKQINGIDIANIINKRSIQYIKTLNGDDIPKLVIIQVGDNSASNIYIRMKKKLCEKIGIQFDHIRFDDNATNSELIKKIDSLNYDKSVTGIIVQSPLPKNLDWDFIVNTISPSKDADGFTYVSQGRAVLGQSLIAPATAKGIVSLIDNINFDISGKNIVIIGRSNIVGKPVANLLINRQATVTVCNSKTKQLSHITKMADLIIVAIGKPKFINKKFISKGQVVIDVGANFINGAYCGDVDYDDVIDLVDKISPVPGGVGPMTVASLIDNVTILHKESKKIR
ncbi:bifunctional 5,10-methylenetetrahydrofolate dehydrogenase/5,10-methenyltetrahydrofolate cyclohydrolase [Spiroplasma endosymbiont of Aspidapion aeneum]|uniref:bifunctional 5,10-methylenetetrahydrofolate dehydrogenase/5,10-methenyltetrahydrofolate cyclohydrolase n=1 Tax=Spiroplasma endosymbiont of Aspidapion aeneum TaxID=3066276 RepID=UPI00313AEDA6